MCVLNRQKCWEIAKLSCHSFWSIEFSFNMSGHFSIDYSLLDVFKHSSSRFPISDLFTDR